MASIVAKTFSEIEIEKQNGDVVSLRVELANTAQKRALGLMYRKSLSPDQGMLFIYDEPKYVSFWMKNTLIPLDLMFINEDGEIIDKVTRTDVLSEKQTISQSPVKYVLETNAGWSNQLGVKLHDTVTFAQ